MNIYAIIGVVALIVGIPASIVITAEYVEKHNGGRLVRRLADPFIRFKNWLVSPRRDIKKLQQDFDGLRAVFVAEAGHTDGRVDQVKSQIDALTTVAEKNNTELKAELTQQAERLNNAMLKFDQAVGTAAVVESSLANFRQWMEQLLTIEDEDGDKIYMGVTAVIGRIEAMENELKELRDTFNRHDVIAAIARSQPKPQERPTNFGKPDL